MEVLIAVFILTFGLMSIAMVIPAGRALMVEASKSDRATACGRAALDHVQIRKWYDPTTMVQKWGSAGVSLSSTQREDDNGNGDALFYGETYLLDPYFFSYSDNEDKDSVRHFPYSAYPEFEFPLARSWPDRARARRVTFLQPGSSGSSVPLFEALAERLTTWADELIFSLESDGKRPRQMASWLEFDPAEPNDPPASVRETAAVPILASDGFDPTNKIRQRPSDEGRFTWAAMITPIVPITYQDTFVHSGTTYDRIDDDLIYEWGNSGALNPPLPLTNPARVTRCEVSIVVFYNRDLYCPEGSGDTNKDELRADPDINQVHERSVYAELIGGGIGGGDVRLFIPEPDAVRPVGYLNVKKNDWIMLKALDRAGFVGNSVETPNCPCIATYPTVCKWYRVVSVDDVEPYSGFRNPANPSSPLDGRARLVTLAGPDWQVDTTNVSNGFYSRNRHRRSRPRRQRRRRLHHHHRRNQTQIAGARLSKPALESPNTSNTTPTRSASEDGKPPNLIAPRSTPINRLTAGPTARAKKHQRAT